MGEQSFVDWLASELERRDMTQADLARRAELSSGTLSNIANGDRRPGERVCRAIARALGIPPEEVYRRAGLLPPEKPRTERIARLIAVIEELPEGDQEFLEDWARLRLLYAQRKGKRREQTPASEQAKTS